MVKQKDVYMAMCLLDNIGMDIYYNGNEVGDLWKAAGAAELRLVRATALENARDELRDYQIMANKDMAALQQRINELQIVKEVN